MRREVEYFGEGELALVYIAKRLRDALALEAALTEAGIEYLVEPDAYRGGFIFQTERIGAFFYVMPENEAEARGLMTSRGWRPYVPTG